MTSVNPGDADRALVQLVREVLPVWIGHLASSREQSGAAVAQMLAAFGELVPQLTPKTTAAVHQAASTDAVDRMYQAFQYEDRVAQMTSLVQRDMERMNNVLAGLDAPMTAQQWMQRLQASYVMAEQHLLDNRAPDAGCDETTFF